MNTLYTFGYTSASPADLQRLIQDNDWWLADIRMSPRSRIPRWNKGQLQAYIGDNYIHIPELGNKNYKTGGEIALAAPEVGLQRVVKLLESKPVVLLCACADVQTCHRKTAAEYITGRIGVQVIHLTPDSVHTLIQAASAISQPAATGATVQYGMPGFADDRIIQEAQPVQLALF